MSIRRSNNIRPSYRQGFARTAGESKYPNLWKGIAGIWAPFLGATGNKLLDWGGKHNTGTVNGATWVPGKALDFDGVNDYLEADSVTSQLNTGSIAFVICFIPTDTISSGHGEVVLLGVSKFPGGTQFEDRIFLDFDSQNDGKMRLLYEEANGGTQQVFSTTDTWIAGREYCIIIQCGDGGARISVDGILENSSANTDCPTVLNNFEVGRRPDTGGAYIKCRIGYVYVYNRVLSASEEKQLYWNLYAFFQRLVSPVGFVVPPVVGNPWNYYAQQ